MRIAVLGTGVVGRTIAARLTSLGHDVTVGTRDVRATLARSADFENVALATFADAAAGADLVVNATPGTASLDVLGQAGADNLAGKVLVDIANPLDFSGGMPPTLNPIGTDSLGEQIQRALPETRVVKTLNTMNCEVMVDPARVPGDHDVFVSGNDADAKKQVTELLASFGWPAANIIDLGGIVTARSTEMLLPIWLSLYQSLGHAEFNFHVRKA